MIDLFWPYIPEEAIEEVSKVLRSRWIGQGPKVNQFEEEFSKKFNQPYCIFLNSGSSALETAFDLLNLTNGDEVISTPLTCTATNIPLIRKGVKIVWADIDKHTLCLDKKDVLKKITGKTKAIVNVHLGGIDNDLGDMPVPVVSDACQALGVFNGDYVCNSFQAIKHITTADGGMLMVNNEQEYRKAKLMRWFGIDREKKIKENWQAYRERAMTFDIEIEGYKRQPTDIMAAMGLVGLKYYDKVIQHRKMIFEEYKKRLSGVSGITLVDGKRNTYWLATVLVDNREEFAKMCFANDIDTNLVQIRNDIYKLFGGMRQELPVMNYIEDKYISLPLTMNTSLENVQFICDKIKGGW